MRQILLLISTLLFYVSLFSQKQALTYYLPDVQYDAAIPTPEQVLGYQVGEWHANHDQLVAYFRTLATAASDKISLHEYGRSHEHRPLIYLLITSKKNHDRLQDIQKEHLALCDPEKSGGMDISKMPVVLYQGASIHGNEPSGANASMLVGYYLAAAQSREVEQLLEEAVIILDPCFNPDGFNRFSSWVNSNKNVNLTGDNADREFNEPWPRGRTNHYWFDLNRDWLPGQQPESWGRIENFQAWKPNILTDHHEMGTHATYFFMPGVPSRVNPVTPKLNQELTLKIGTFHAKALDEIGSLYYTREDYDDFYYGKGSTYPDAQGCIGILLEQASSRGHLQNSQNGPLSFAFTIRNQVRTALGTQKAAIALRTELLEYQRDFYKKALEEARQDECKAFVVGEKYDRARLLKFIEMARRQKVKVYELAQKVTAGGKDFEPGSAFLIPLEQNQYKLILGMFQRDTVFGDSIFYDISAWTLPLAFNLEYEALGSRAFSKKMVGKEVEAVNLPPGRLNGTAEDYAFAFDWDEYYAPAALFYLLENGLTVKVASKPFQGETAKGLWDFNYGAIVISTQNQPVQGEALAVLLRKAAAIGHLDIQGLRSGLTPGGIDLGSNNMKRLQKPKVLLLAGEGVSPSDAGEVWHLLDTRYSIPVAKVDPAKVSQAVLDRFNVVIMPSGSYHSLSVEALRSWLNGGGTLIACRDALKWLENKQLAYVSYKKNSDETPPSGRLPYAKAGEDRAALHLPGSIFSGELDLTHPLAYGYRRSLLPVFHAGHEFLEPSQSPYAMPLAYTSQPLMAGYMHRKFAKQAGGSASVVVCGHGSGRVICFADNTNLRAFWYGTNKLLANAIFFGSTISGQTVEWYKKK